MTSACATDLFIGVVSHTRSRFADAQGPDGLAARLSAAWADLGGWSEVTVNTSDLLPASGIELTPAVIRESPAEELRIEREWARFLERPMGATWWATHAARWARYWARRRSSDSPAAVTRLLNIELSHLDLMRRALASSASWALILEDDAGSSEILDLAAGLRGITSGLESVSPRFANLSESFGVSTLGIGHLMTSVAGVSWVGTASRVIYSSRKPVTNTVCAVLYRRDFLADLVACWDRLPMTPVAPIDWKLNRALMELWRAGSLGPSDCWWVEPGPILQRSMHS